MTTFLYNLCAYLVAISILVAVHEFGHFWVARRVGVKVLRFSIGFGRVLWRRNLKDGTEFAISAIPVGGYVSMLGESDNSVPAHEAHRAFRAQPAHKRIAVMAAGPVINFLFAIPIYWLLFAVSSPGVKPMIGEVSPNSIAAQAGLHSDDLILAVNGKETQTREAVVLAMLRGLLADNDIDVRVAGKNESPRELRLNGPKNVSELTAKSSPLTVLGFDFWHPQIPAKLGVVVGGSAGDLAGLKVGDEILKFNGETVVDYLALRKMIMARGGQDVTVEVRRDDQILDIAVKIGTQTVEGRQVGLLGVAPMSVQMPAEMVLPSDSIVGALGRSIRETADKTMFVFQTVYYLVAGKISLQSISGPVGIAVVTGEAARIGFLPFITLLALVSISIGALNLLPIPVLDGGQIVLQLVELVKGGPVSERALAVVQYAGFAVLALLTLLALVNDIVRLT